jgi:hypothetical protein
VSFGDGPDRGGQCANPEKHKKNKKPKRTQPRPGITDQTRNAVAPDLEPCPGSLPGKGDQTQLQRFLGLAGQAIDSLVEAFP